MDLTQQVAAGIIWAFIPYFLIKTGWKLLRQDTLKFIETLDKIIGIALIVVGIGIAFKLLT